MTIEAGLMKYNATWKFEPTEIIADYDTYRQKVGAAANTPNVMYPVDKLAANSVTGITTKAQELNRLALKTRLTRLRETAASGTTWQHYYCEATKEEMFLMTPAHWGTQFTVV